MNPVALLTLLVLCVVIAFILADKKMIKESKKDRFLKKESTQINENTKKER